MGDAKLRASRRDKTILRIMVWTCVMAGNGAGAGTVSAQAPTTLQFPIFSSFSSSTSVAVPDRGSIVVGGVERGAQGLLSQGVSGASHVPGAGRLFRNQAVGREVGQSSAQVSVWIHDLRAMDEALLAEARSNRSANDRAANDPAASRGGDARGGMAPRGERPVAVDSVAEIRRQRALEVDRAETEARDLLRQGDQASVDGKPGVARIYYQMAARRSPSTLGPEIQARLRRLSPGPRN
jgi:Flp pilus assembly secretin CpaC